MRSIILYVIFFLVQFEAGSAQESSKCYWSNVVETSNLTDSTSLLNIYVLDKPRRRVWEKRKNPNCQTRDPDDCLVWCHVELPEEYRLEQMPGDTLKLVEALCPFQVTEEVIRQIQESLSWHGTYSGEISGIWDRPTEKGMADYQKKHGLQMGYMTKESMTHLDIRY